MEGWEKAMVLEELQERKAIKIAKIFMADEEEGALRILEVLDCPNKEHLHQLLEAGASDEEMLEEMLDSAGWLPLSKAVVAAQRIAMKEEILSHIEVVEHAHGDFVETMSTWTLRFRTGEFGGPLLLSTNDVATYLHGMTDVSGPIHLLRAGAMRPDVFVAEIIMRIGWNTFVDFLQKRSRAARAPQPVN